MCCGVWIPALAEFTVGPRFARTRWLGRDDRREVDEMATNGAGKPVKFTAIGKMVMARRHHIFGVVLAQAGTHTPRSIDVLRSMDPGSRFARPGRQTRG